MKRFLDLLPSNLRPSGLEDLIQIPEQGASPFAYIVFGVVIAFLILLIVAIWKMFRKAKVPGWFAIIPVLSIFGLVKCATGSYAKTFLLLIPLFNFVYAIILNFKLSYKFGHKAGFGFGLWLLPAIFTLILGFGKSVYHKNA